MAYNINKPFQAPSVAWQALPTNTDKLEPGQSQSIRTIIDRFSVGDIANAGTRQQSSYAISNLDLDNPDDVEAALNSPVPDFDNHMDAVDGMRQYSLDFEQVLKKYRNSDPPNDNSNSDPLVDPSASKVDEKGA